MANTKMIAKNTFGEGLVMDFAPDNTQANVLTSALNATLLTFNGNEMSLQNDMGNGRVETARLPEGYIPVGSCEFGDIIYIVSYNPLINKSQIGCFPSPERNISSEEVGSRDINISYKTFQDTQNNTPNGRILTNSVKYVLFDKSLNPGDKYIINYNGDLGNSGAGLEENKMLSDLGNTSKTYGTFPKLLKLHVVSIEDSGKITFLDNTVKWYDNGDLPYFIINSIRDASSNKLNKEDLDTYRSLVSSEYSVFLSKVSGKLAILAELEKIKGFSCTYAIYPETEIVGKVQQVCGTPTLGGYGQRCETTTKTEMGFLEQTMGALTYGIGEIGTAPEESENKTYHIEKITAKQYHVFFDINWETDDPNINPKYIVLTKGKWKDQVSRIQLEDEVIHSRALALIPKPDSTDFPIFSFSKPPEGMQMATQLYSFEQKGWNELNAYQYATLSGWASEISRQYEPENFEGTYQDFQETGSYQARLDSFLKDLVVLSSTTKSYKLVNSLTTLNNVNYTATYPSEGNYYINVAGYMLNDDGESIPFTYNQDNEPVTITEPISITDDIVNNFFKTSILKNFARFIIPTKYYQIEQTGSDKYTNEYNFDNSDLIYNYTIAPAMPYGILDEYAIDGYIDFSKINSGDINLTGWKYYNTDNVSTLNFSVEAYPEPNKGISEIVLEFYDNQGIAAAYHITGRKSYSGSFTEYIPLNDPKANYKLNNIDAHDNIIKHAGIKYDGDEDLDDVVEITEDGPIERGKYHNDAGTLYSNVVYLVKVVIKYCNVNSIGQFESEYNSNIDYSNTTYYRWFWTNKMYNDRYFDTSDFNSLSFNLALATIPEYRQGESYKYDEFDYASNSPTAESATKNMQAIVQRIIGDVNVKFKPALINNYNCFLLNKNYIGELSYTLYDGDLKVSLSKEDINILHTNSNHADEIKLILPNIIDIPETNDDGVIITGYGDFLKNHYKTIFENTQYDDYQYQEIWENVDNYRDLCLIRLNDSEESEDSIECVSELNPQRTNTEGLPCITNLFDSEDPIKINLDIINFSKYYTEVNMVEIDVNVYRPVLYSTSDLTEYGLNLDSDGHVYFLKLLKNRIFSNNQIDKSVSRYSLESTIDGKLFDTTADPSSINRQEITKNASFSLLGRLEGEEGISKVELNFVDTDKINSKLFLYGYDRTQVDNNPDAWYNDDIILNLNNDPAISSDKSISYSQYGIGLTPYSNIVKSTVGVSYDTCHNNFFGGVKNKKIDMGGAIFNKYNDSNYVNSSNYLKSYANLMIGFKGDSKDNIHLLNTAFPSMIDGNKLRLNFKIPVVKSLSENPRYEGDGFIYIVVANDIEINNSEDLKNFDAYINVRYGEDIYSAMCIFGGGYKIGIIKTFDEITKNRGHRECWKIPETGFKLTIDNSGYLNAEKVDDSIKTKIEKVNGYIPSSSNLPILINSIGTLASYFTGESIGSLNENFWSVDRYTNTKEDVEYYIGDMVTSILSNIYNRKDNMEPALVPQITDIAYLEDYAVRYRKEFICNINIDRELDQNKLIIIGERLSYYEYLESVLSNIETEEKTKICRNNVDVQLQSSALTHPFEILLQYKKPSSRQLSSSINSKIYVPGRDPIYLQLDGANSSKSLYTLTESSNLEKLNGNNFKCTYYKKFSTEVRNDDSVIKPVIIPGELLLSETNSNLFNLFSSDNGNLICRFSDKVGNAYGITYSDENGNFRTSILDLLQQDILIPSLMVVNNNIIKKL